MHTFRNSRFIHKTNNGELVIRETACFIAVLRPTDSPWAVLVYF